MRTLVVEASQEKRRISRHKATAADPELKVSSGEGGGGVVLRPLPSQHLYQLKSF